MYAAPELYRSTHLGRAFGAPASASGMREAGSRIPLAPGQARSGVDVALLRSLAIEGRVLDSSDEPLAETEVTVSRPGGARSFTYPAVSDDRGAFRVFGLQPGRYRVCTTPRERSRTGDGNEDGIRPVRTCHLASTSEEHAREVIVTTEDVVGIDIRVQQVGSRSVSGRSLMPPDLRRARHTFPPYRSTAARAVPLRSRSAESSC